MSENATVPRFNVHTTDWTPLPELGGHEAILYKSEDGRRLAGSFRESGRHTMKMPFDEFIYVVAGSTRITVEGEDPFDLGVGDCCYLKEGMEVTFEHSEDFHDVTVLISDQPIEY
ncbi:MAG: cupin domain-containing protein [Rhodococcus sp. (in: high G+C Gram-positive bacteria)]